MIRANELRVGNYILVSGKLTYVNIDVLQSVIRTPQVKRPIPLTPEILDKCGFAMLHHLGKLQPTLQIDSSLEFHWLDDTLFVTYTQENYDENINLAALIIERPLRHIKYLHHLQNYIYFSTNVELAYKP